MFKFGEQNMFAHHWQPSNNAYFQIRSYVWAVNANMWVSIPTLVIATATCALVGRVECHALSSRWRHKFCDLGCIQCIRAKNASALTPIVYPYSCAHTCRERYPVKRGASTTISKGGTTIFVWRCGREQFLGRLTRIVLTKRVGWLRSDKLLTDKRPALGTRDIAWHLSKR